MRHTTLSHFCASLAFVSIGSVSAQTYQQTSNSAYSSGIRESVVPAKNSAQIPFNSAVQPSVQAPVQRTFSSIQPQYPVRSSGDQYEQFQGDTGNTNVVMTADMVRPSDSMQASARPGRLTNTFNCDQLVYAYTTIYSKDVNPLPKFLEGTWFMNGKKVNTKVFEPHYYNDPHHVWYWINAAEMGSGAGRFDLMGEGKLIKSTNFNVAQGTCKNSGQVAPIAAAPQPRTLGGVTLHFAYSQAGAQNLLPESQQQLSQLINEIKANRNSVSRIVVTGHSDRLGRAERKIPRSQARADTIRDYLVRSAGIDAGIIRSVGAGDSQPIKECAGNDESSLALQQCLQPNRRVTLEIFGNDR